MFGVDIIFFGVNIILFRLNIIFFKVDIILFVLYIRLLEVNPTVYYFQIWIIFDSIFLISPSKTVFIDCKGLPNI